MIALCDYDDDEFRRYLGSAQAGRPGICWIGSVTGDLLKHLTANDIANMALEDT